MNRLTSFSILTVAFALVGCSASENPIFEDGDTIVIEGLEGEWEIEFDDGVSGEIVINRIESSNKYQLEFIGAGPFSENEIEFAVVEIGQRKYLDVYIPGTCHGHLILRLENDDEGYVLTCFDLEQARGSELLPHEIDPLHLDLKSGGFSVPIPRSVADSGLRVTATTEQLQEFLANHPDLYRGEKFSLRRKSGEQRP